MNRKTFIKSLGLIGGSLMIAPQLLIPKESEEISESSEPKRMSLEEMRRQKLREHMIEMERAFLFGVSP